MSKMIIKTYVLGMVSTNCYIVANKETGEALVIDPSDKAEKIEEFLAEEKLVCKFVLLTHGHFDHIMAVDDFVKGKDIPIYAHKNEEALLLDPRLNHSYNLGKGFSVQPDVLLEDGEELDLIGFKIRVIHTPGHTAGGVCYHFIDENVMFSGDTLFRANIGRWDLPTGNGEQLVKSINEKLMILDNDIVVYPGHEMPTTIGYERENNPYI